MTQPPGFLDLVVAFARVGVISFGGAAGRIAPMRRVLVDERRWLDEPRFPHTLNHCMMPPGPVAHQPAAHVGSLTRGARVGLAAGLFFVALGAAVPKKLSIGRRHL